MAKSKSFFGLRRGSTKSLTFSIYEGQQVTKDRVTEVKNPRTPAQMLQRMVMSTALAQYSAGKEIFDHSFQGVTYGAKSMNRFLSEAAKRLREDYDAGNAQTLFNVYGNRAPLGSAIKVSEGSLIPFGTAAVRVNDSGTVLSILGGVGESLTVGALKATFGLSAGDYATVIAFAYGSGTIDIGVNVQPNNGQLVYARLYMPDASDDTLITEANIAEILNIEYKGIQGVSLTVEGNGEAAEQLITITLPASVQGVTGVAAIKSAKLNGVWARSTQYLRPVRGTDFVTAEQALSTYPIGPAYILNGGNANE